MKCAKFKKDLLNFIFLGKGLVLVSPPHFANGF